MNNKCINCGKEEREHKKVKVSDNHKWCVGNNDKFKGTLFVSNANQVQKGCGKSFRDSECDEYEFIICGYDDKELGGVYYCDDCNAKDGMEENK